MNNDKTIDSSNLTGQPADIAARCPDLKDRLAGLASQRAKDEENIFPLRLKMLRQELNLTQNELAEILGVPMRTYANWEQGRSFPSIERLPHIAAFFDVTVDYLLGVNRDTINHRVMDQLAILTPEQRKAVELVLVSMKKEAE
jgi:transcriptional regulator with XRE-family HTH domain